MAKFLMFLLLYLVAVTTIIAIFAAGLGGFSGVPYATVDYPQYNTTDEEGILDWIGLGGVDDAMDAGGMFASVMKSMYMLLLYNVSEDILPLWANVILIKIPLIALIIALVEVILP